METQVNDFGFWIVENWAIVALIISEAIAITPGKYKGILQFLFKIAGNIVTRKSSKS